MTESAVDPSDSVGSSRDADVAAGYDDAEAGDEAPTNDFGTDGGVQDSHAADVDAGYDDASDSPTVPGPSVPWVAAAWPVATSRGDPALIEVLIFIGYRPASGP